MSGQPYTFDELRATLVRQRNRSAVLGGELASNDSERMSAVVDRMIALIDAMTTDERKLANVLQLTPARQEELATATGTSVREVQGLLAGRRSIERTKRLFLSASR